MNEKGQALIESLLIGLLLLVPVMWLLMVLADVHRAALATNAAVREAGFDAARAGDISEADAAVDRAVGTALSNHGLDPSRAEARWTASPGLERNATVEVVTTYRVAVLRVPFLGAASGPSVSVTARHLARIDPYRSEE